MQTKLDTRWLLRPYRPGTTSPTRNDHSNEGLHVRPLRRWINGGTSIAARRPFSENSSRCRRYAHTSSLPLGVFTVPKLTVPKLCLSFVLFAAVASAAFVAFSGGTAAAGNGAYCTAAPNPAAVGSEAVVRAFGLSNKGGQVWVDELWPDGSRMTFLLSKGSTAFATRPPLAGNYTYAFVNYGANGTKKVLASCTETAF